MHKTNGVLDPVVHPWSLIGGERREKESFEEAMSRTVEKETGIKIENIERISDFKYHAALTDDNINKIQRGEFQLLDFFAPKDLQKLLLSDSTQEFVSNYSYLTDNTSLVSAIK